MDTGYGEGVGVGKWLVTGGWQDGQGGGGVGRVSRERPSTYANRHSERSEESKTSSCRHPTRHTRDDRYPGARRGLLMPVSAKVTRGHRKLTGKITLKLHISSNTVIMCLYFPCAPTPTPCRDCGGGGGSDTVTCMKAWPIYMFNPGTD